MRAPAAGRAAVLRRFQHCEIQHFELVRRAEQHRAARRRAQRAQGLDRIAMRQQIGHDPIAELAQPRCREIGARDRIEADIAAMRQRFQDVRDAGRRIAEILHQLGQRQRPLDLAETFQNLEGAGDRAHLARSYARRLCTSIASMEIIR